MATWQYQDQHKIHETSVDRERQRKTLRSFCTALDLYFQMTAALSEFDAKLYTSTQYVGIAEVKFRNNPIDRYPDYQIDASKIDSLINTARREGVRAVLIVSWQHDIRYLPLSKIAEGWEGQCDIFSTTKTKRKDRREYADNQYHIPYELFKRI